MDLETIDLHKAGTAFAYIFVMDWRAGMIALIRVGLAAEAVSPGCLTGATNVRA